MEDLRDMYRNVPKTEQYIAELEKHNEYLKNENCFKTARLQCLWEYLQKLNEDTGIEPPDHFFNWFDADGIPKPLAL